MTCRQEASNATTGITGGPPKQVDWSSAYNRYVDAYLNRRLSLRVEPGSPYDKSRRMHRLPTNAPVVDRNRQVSDPNSPWAAAQAEPFTEVDVQVTDTAERLGKMKFGV